MDCRGIIIEHLMRADCYIVFWGFHSFFIKTSVLNQNPLTSSPSSPTPLAFLPPSVWIPQLRTCFSCHRDLFLIRGLCPASRLLPYSILSSRYHSPHLGFHLYSLACYNSVSVSSFTINNPFLKSLL